MSLALCLMGYLQLEQVDHWNDALCSEMNSAFVQHFTKTLLLPCLSVRHPMGDGSSWEQLIAMMAMVSIFFILEGAVDARLWFN